MVDCLVIGPVIEDQGTNEVSNDIKDRASIQIFFNTERLPKFYRKHMLDFQSSDSSSKIMAYS